MKSWSAKHRVLRWQAQLPYSASVRQYGSAAEKFFEKFTGRSYYFLPGILLS
jgi:hypothetical protein